jgi:hypothetical protein
MQRHLVLLLAVVAAAAVATPAEGAARAGLHVSGHRLVDGAGRTVVLNGVDRAGTEYACIQGWGIFDGPDQMNDDAQAPLMAAWKVNVVNIGLNEDCWLGINGVKSRYGGANYRKAIIHQTKTLESHGITPVIALFWSAPGRTKAMDQAPMPDADHSPAFWRSVARTFKGDRKVILRLKEEPYPAGNSDTPAAWRCWKKGDVQYGRSGRRVSRHRNCNEGYRTVGMQSLVNIIRSTGAKNVIQVPGVQYANSMTRFLSRPYRVRDTLRKPQLMAVVDVYPRSNACGSVRCYNGKYAPVIRRMPFMAGEIGESNDSGGSCPTSAVETLMHWLDKHGAGYAAWTWNTWGGCNQLISSHSTGAPNGRWGRVFRDHLAQRR